MEDKKTYNYLIMLPYSKILGSTTRPMSVDEIIEQLKAIDTKMDYNDLKEDQKSFVKQLSNLFCDMLSNKKITAKEYAAIKIKLMRLRIIELDLLKNIIMDTISGDNYLQQIEIISENLARLKSFSNKMLEFIDSEYDIDTVKLIIENEKFQELIYKNYDEQFNYLDDKEDMQKLHNINKQLILYNIYEKKNSEYKRQQQIKDISRKIYIKRDGLVNY